MSNFSCAESNVNEQNSLFKLICINLAHGNKAKPLRGKGTLQHFSLADARWFYSSECDACPLMCFPQTYLSLRTSVKSMLVLLLLQSGYDICLGDILNIYSYQYNNP